MEIAELQAELDNSEDQRNSLKDDLNEVSEKIIGLEEELYESKTI
jgi:septal ring factor EnvC (AmiA/AmiB activator)